MYVFTKNPQKHFVYNYHTAKDLALELKEKGIKRIKTDEDMQLRLKFYGINSSKNLVLERVKRRKQAHLSIVLGPHNEYYAIKKVQ